MFYLTFFRAHARFLVFGFALTFFSSFGQTFFISLFNDGIRATFDLDHGAFGLVYSCATLASGLTLIWAGRRLDDTGLRLFTLLLGVGLAAACGSWPSRRAWLCSPSRSSCSA